MISHMREDIQSIFHRDPAARHTLEVLTCYPGLHAIWFHRVAHWFWLRNWKLLARLVSHISRWLTGIEIHPGAKIGRRFFIDHGMGVVIGETAEIGNDVTLYHGVTLGGTTWNKGKRHPTLEDGVVVGAGAKVLGPFTVGAGAKIGSNAVVTKEVPAGATAVGIPGRIIEAKKDQSPEQADFDTYGISGDMPDPVARSIGAILAHMKAMEGRVDGMCDALRDLGSDYCAEQLPELPDNGLYGQGEEAPEQPAAKAQETSETSS